VRRGDDADYGKLPTNSDLDRTERGSSMRRARLMRQRIRVSSLDCEKSASFAIRS
jgi:hypothetical protein